MCNVYYEQDDRQDTMSLLESYFFMLQITYRVLLMFFCSIVVLFTKIGVREFAMAGLRMLIMLTCFFCSGFLLLPTVMCFCYRFDSLNNLLPTFSCDVTKDSLLGPCEGFWGETLPSFSVIEADLAA